jgi:hypothetical protein
MATPEMVATNVRTTFEALGMQEREGGAAEAARETEALREVQSMLSGKTWSHGPFALFLPEP